MAAAADAKDDSELLEDPVENGAGPLRARPGRSSTQEWWQRGLDAGLTAMCPLQFSNQEREYKEFRRQGRLFQRACERRSELAAIEGAMMLYTSFPGQAWDALECLTEAEMEAAGAFNLI